MTGFAFTLEAIVQSFQSLLEYIGTDWFQEHAAPFQGEPTAEELARHEYIYHQPVHPLIELYSLFPSWKAQCEQHGSIWLSEQIVNIALLGQALQKIRADKKFDKLVARLKNPDEFYSTAFEIVIAASYISQQWYVEFIEEGDIPTPDLYVSDNEGTSFWVECKNRDKTNELDKRTESLWQQVERRLIRYLEEHRLNYQIVLSALEEMRTSSDASYVIKFIIETIEHKFEPRFLLRLPGASITVQDSTGRFELTIHKLSEPDVSLDGKSFKFPTSRDKADHGTFICERTDLENGGIRIRNPRVIQFHSQSSADRIQAVKHAFKAALKQLPESGPGIIHIRLPINSWVKDLDQTITHIEHYLHKELSASHNRRVNAVIVSIYYSELVQEGALQHPIYKPFTILAEHKNPKIKLRTALPQTPLR